MVATVQGIKRAAAPVPSPGGNKQAAMEFENGGHEESNIGES
jgi:hypothetical protein